MSKMTLKQHKIAALKHARNLIKSGKEEYICHALNHYTDWYDIENSKKEQAIYYLKQYIAKNLGCEKDSWGEYSNHKGLQEWLVKENHVKFYPVYNSKKMRNTRLNWIDWMIGCYEGTV